MADNDSALSKMFRKLVNPRSILCWFHAKKAVADEVWSKQYVPREDQAIFEGEIMSDFDGMFYAGDEAALDATWCAFKVRWAKYPLLINYIDLHWMSPEWRLLWTGAGRNSFAHHLLDTSNPAETFFNTAKNFILGGKRPSDVVTFIQKLVGHPDNESSVRASYR